MNWEPAGWVAFMDVPQPPMPKGKVRMVSPSFKYPVRVTVVGEDYRFTWKAVSDHGYAGGVESSLDAAKTAATTHGQILLDEVVARRKR